MTPDSIKSTLALLDKHSPRDPVISKIGLTPEQVRRALGTPPQKRNRSLSTKAKGMSLESARKYLPFLREYLKQLRSGSAAGHAAVRALADQMGYSLPAAKNVMYSKFGSCAPTVLELAAFVRVLERRLG